jgi:FMN phosphatase YigB (HAD superfamily)
VKTIAWDVDDVLNDLTREWFEYQWLPYRPDCSLDYERLTENPPDTLLGISRAEYLASLDDFRLSEFAKTIRPVSEVLAWFRDQGQYCRHIALTAAPLRAASASAAWVMRCFGNWIRSFHIVASPRPEEIVPVYDATKGDFLRWWGKVDVLIEDNPANVASAQQLGIGTVLISRPWNKGQLTLNQSLNKLTNLVR